MTKIEKSNHTDAVSSVNVNEQHKSILQGRDSECDKDENETACTLSSPSSLENTGSTVSWDQVAELVAEMILIRYRREQRAASSANGQLHSESEMPENASLTKKESRGQL